MASVSRETFIRAAAIGAANDRTIHCQRRDASAGAAKRRLRASRSHRNAPTNSTRKPLMMRPHQARPGAPPGWGYYWKSHYLPPLSDAAIDAMVGLAWQKASPASFSLLCIDGKAWVRVHRRGAHRP